VPCPDAGVTFEIQLTSAEALHAHSACVVTETVPVPPPDPIVADAGEMATSHFAGVGCTDIVELEPQPLSASARAAAGMGMDRCLISKLEWALRTIGFDSP
jgi:hypothetical protein